MIQELQAILDAHQGEKGKPLPVLIDIQKRFGYITLDALKYISGPLNTSVNLLYELITFYPYFPTSPPGKHRVTVCSGTPCREKGADGLITAARGRLGIGPGQTTADGRFSLLAVDCIGCCAQAPLVMVDEETQGQVTAEGLKHVLEEKAHG